ncbi:MAG: 3-hydroxybutyrate dehydrogenase [Rhodospirillaceae bacterium]|nr:3-hydroxybutyrate dehydrogenase [Rhodospirillaceae bacterium]|tara:strand:+ start:281 stop:1063 length:783 start_codon:yes stop_codon:yes gene_type:complete
MLEGKRALVTGSTSGIGLAYAKALAAKGCSITLNGMADQPTIDDAIKQVDAAGTGSVHFSDADMRKPDEIRAMVSDAVSEMGGIDILVNNAGIQHVAPIEEFADEMWNDILAINLSSLFHTIKAALPQMRERNWGRIINTSSTHGLVASPEKAAYVATKHGVVGLTKVVALETAESGITCNAICPGSTRTALAEWQIEKYAQEQGIDFESAAAKRLAERTPSKTYVQVEQLAGLAVFLCSDAASQMTGVALPMDGGWTAT